MPRPGRGVAPHVGTSHRWTRRGCRDAQGPVKVGVLTGGGGDHLLQPVTAKGRDLARPGGGDGLDQGGLARAVVTEQDRRAGAQHQAVLPDVAHNRQGVGPTVWIYLAAIDREFLDRCTGLPSSPERATQAQILLSVAYEAGCCLCRKSMTGGQTRSGSLTGAA